MISPWSTQVAKVITIIPQPLAMPFAIRLHNSTGKYVKYIFLPLESELSWPKERSRN